MDLVGYKSNSMVHNKALLKEQVSELSKKELVEIVIKLSAKKPNFNFLLINYLDKNGGEQSLYDEVIEDIEVLYQKEYKGRTIQHQMVKRLKASTKKLTEFTSSVKNKKLEADLMVYLLELELSQPSKVFGARFSGYDYKVGLLLKKLISLVSKKMHPDYLIDYQDKINDFLDKIHQTSNQIQTIKDLPNAIEL